MIMRKNERNIDTKSEAFSSISIVTSQSAFAFASSTTRFREKKNALLTLLSNSA